MSSRAEFGGILFDFLASEIHDRFLPPFAATQRARVSSYVGPWHSKNSKPCLCSHKCARKLDRGAAAAAAAASYQSSAIVGRKILGLRIFVCRCADPIQSSQFFNVSLFAALRKRFSFRAQAKARWMLISNVTHGKRNWLPLKLKGKSAQKATRRRWLVPIGQQQQHNDYVRDRARQSCNGDGPAWYRGQPATGSMCA